MPDSNAPSVYLYPEVIAFVVFIILYTCGSAMSAGLAHILFRLNGKQVVYVSLMSLSIFLQNILTVIQEIFSCAEWSSIQIDIYERNLQQWRNSDASLVYETSPNTFIKVLFGTRTYFFNVESLLFFFWSFMLFVSVWEIRSPTLKSEKFVAGTKYFAFIFPALQTLLTNLAPIKRIPVLHLVFANCIMVITLSSGCIFMSLILFKCSRVIWSSNWSHKLKLLRGYDNGHRQVRGQGTSVSIGSIGSSSESEDNYILLRFLAGFAVIGGLQASFMMSQATYAQGVLKRKQPDAEKPHLGWTSKEQLEDWAFYLASGSTGYLILIVFGTTRESRRQMRRLWASLRSKVHIGNKKNGEYISFRSENDSAAYEHPPSPEMSEATERRRPKSTPKPMTFVSSRATPLRSPDGKMKSFSPAEAYKDIDLKTPRLPK